jgi:hypothetical protein
LQWRAALRQNDDTELPSMSFQRISQMRVPQTPNERLAALYRQLALTTSHHRLEKSAGFRRDARSGGRQPLGCASQIAKELTEIGVPVSPEPA